MQEFNYKKKYGQNFLTDTNLLNAIVKDAQIDKNTYVLEIGVGKGALTKSLIKTAGYVLGYEIDLSLKPYLEQTFSDVTNLEIRYCDFMEININSLNLPKNFGVVANIPYYITTPIIFKFLENATDFKMCLLVQKEVAEKIVAKPKTSNYGILSVLCQYQANCKLARTVSRKLFMPQPKVDSAVVILEVDKNYDIAFSKFVKASFSMRRKTLVNNIVNGYSCGKEKFEKLLEKCGYLKNIRAEELSPTQFKQLYELFSTIKD